MRLREVWKGAAVASARLTHGQSLKESAVRIKNQLRARGFTNEVVELPDSTHTAKEAATAVGVRWRKLGSRLSAGPRS